jgi:integrase
MEDEDHDARALTREELTTFLSLVVDRRWQAFFRLLASTGLRFSEVIGLEWRHVHLDGSKPHLKIRQRIVKGSVGPPKSRHGRRTVPLPHSLVVDLRHLQSTTEYPGDQDPVFASRTGTPLMYGNVFRRQLKPVAEEAGVSWTGFHTFRHTCASMLIADGRNIVQVSRWLGHHSPSFTLSTYAHLMDEGIGAALDIGAPESGPTDAPASGASTIDAAELDALLSAS